jgi:ABC-type transport system involved in cytochrome bd biosynthesis fused ATPase/permease subunit
MKGQMTILIITHREALIALADEVYSMQAGVLVQTAHESQEIKRKAA